MKTEPPLQFFNSYYGSNQFEEIPSTLKHLPLKKSAFKAATSMGKLHISGNTISQVPKRLITSKVQTSLTIKNQDIKEGASEYHSSIDGSHPDMQRKSTLRHSNANI